MLNIKIDRPKSLPGLLSCYLTFSKFDQNWINIIREFETRRYDPETKSWEFPVFKLSDVIRRYEGVPVTIYYNPTNCDNIIHMPEIKLNINPDSGESYKLFKHQIEAIEYGLTNKKFILADDMGCVAGNTIVTAHYRTNPNSRYPINRNIRIDKLYEIHKQHPEMRITVRSLLGDHFGQAEVSDILYSGVKDTWRMETESGKSVEVTKDHEILTPQGWKMLQELSVGDVVYTNGISKCKMCGSSKNLIKYPYAKFVGYCKPCMYKMLRKNKYHNETVSEDNPVLRLGNDGYLRIFYNGVMDHPNYRADGLCYHIYLMTKKIGRPLMDGEVVHHIDGNKLNNNIENLKLMTASEHSKLHAEENTKNFYKNFYKNGNEIVMVPKEDKIISITHVGRQPTYDIIVENTNHNFLANKIVVHNSGKTLAIIGLVLSLKKMGILKQALIVVCVSDLQWNWAKQIERYTNESYHILGEREKIGKNGKPRKYMSSVADRVKDLKTHKETFLITNQVTLRNEKFIDMLRGEYKTYQNRIQLLCIDEFHKGTGNPTSIAGKNLQKLKNLPYIIPMTGTPLRNHPIEAWAPLKLIGKEQSTYSAFKNMFCVYNNFGGISGYKNLDYLQAELSTCMLRRTKAELMPWLPDKIHDVSIVTMNDRQQSIYDEAYSWALSNIDMIGTNPNPLAQLIRLRQATGYTGILSSTIKESAKLDRMEDDVDSILSNSQKVMIYSNWTDITKEIVMRLSKKYNVLEITGNLVGCTNRDKSVAMHVEEVKSLFNTKDNGYDIIVCTSKAGAGHDLIGGSWCLFVDEPWTYADKAQIEDRLHRPGQKNSVNIRTYITKDTIDERVHNIVENKGIMAEYVIDGNVKNEGRMKLTKYLLGIE